MLSDTRDFEKRLATADSPLYRFFDAAGPITVGRAPGRLDVIGGVADYSGSLVAQATIAEATHVALQVRGDDVVRVWSSAKDLECPLVEISTAELKGAPEVVGRRLIRNSNSRWAANVLGCYTALIGEKLLSGHIAGANIFIESKVPLSDCLSSSATLSVASMLAITGAYRITIEPELAAVLAHRVEDLIVGAPCGIVNQMAVAFGKVDRLLLVLCQPHSVEGYTTLPAGVKLFGIQSGIYPAVSCGPYCRARAAAFMGRRLINERRLHKQEDPLSYLCEATPNRYRREYASLLPGKISGAEFQEIYGSHDDPATRVDPDVIYPVRASTEHAIYENARVKSFLTCVEEAHRSSGSQQSLALIRAGMAMYASHWSYTRIGLGCRETTMLARLAREAGPARGIFGAKITGGGSGGVVAVLTCGEDVAEVIEEIACEYARLTGNDPAVVVGGKSPGAVAFGNRTVVLS